MKKENLEKVEITFKEQCLLIQAIARQIDDYKTAINYYNSNEYFNEKRESEKNSLFNQNKTDAEINTEIDEQKNKLVFVLENDCEQFENLLNKIKGVTK